MPLGAARLTLLAFQPTVAVVAEVIRKKQSIQAFGNAQIDTAQYKFGGSSADFDGSGDYVTASNTITLDGDFTIEVWYRADNLPGTGLVPLFTFSDGHLFYIGYSGGNTVYDFYKAGSKVTLVPVTISGSTWYHAACVRSGSTISIYHNGTLNTTGTYSGTITATLDLAKYSTYYFDGHFDEVRVSDSARYTSGFTPSTTPFVNDDDTKLLLHCDGSDASTYFDDDNGVGRAAVGVSAVATAQIDTAQSYFGGSSALFNPSSLDHLFVEDISGSNDLDTNWTFECWYRPTNRTGTVYPVILANQFSTWASGDWGFFDRHNAASTKFTFFINAYSSVNPALESTTVVSNGTWYHLAVVKQGNDYELFVDGTSEDTLTTAAAIATNRDLRIGSSGNATTKTVNGHIDEIRISNTARYTTNFTRPTAPFVNDANTKLLLHCDGSDGSTLFLDDNGTQGRGNAVVATAKNNAQLSTAQYKFGGSSALFDGTDDIIAIGRDDDSNYVLVPRTGEFTWELWIRFDNVNTGQIFVASSIYGAYGGGNPAGRAWLGLYYGKPTFVINGGPLISDTTDASANTWYHFAASRDSSNDIRFFLDGTLIGTSNSSVTIAAGYVALGGTGNAYDLDFDGYIDELRISDTCRYTASFTPQTEPFTNDANTLALFHFNGANASTTFLDDCGRQKKGIKAIGNGHTETSQSKFGGTSYEATNQGNYLDLDNFGALGSGDWTMEAFVRFKVLSGAQMVFDWRPPSTQGAYPTLYVSGTTLIFYQSSGSRISSGGVLGTNTWYHFAVCKSGSDTKLFIDGTQVGSTYTDNNNYLGERLRLFGDGFSAGNATLDGFVDEVRISKSARYTANFTPTTEPFQNDANTLLLLHMDGTDGDADFVDDNGKESA